MTELDGLNVERVGSELEPIYVITEKKVSVGSVQALVVTAIDFVSPEELWDALNGLEEDAVLTVKGNSQELGALDIFDEIEDAFEYARIDISSFN